jgi:hypothetical protein
MDKGKIDARSTETVVKKFGRPIWAIVLFVVRAEPVHCTFAIAKKIFQKAGYLFFPAV